MASIIDGIINQIIEVEGETYTNDPADNGGPTKYGITQNTLSQYRRKPVTAEDVRLLTRIEAFQIYYDKYVVEPRFDLLERINARIAAEVIDTGVNMGTGMATKFLQRSLNALNNKGAYRLLDVDGVMGTNTANALKDYLNQRGEHGEFILLTTLNALQGARYVELTEAKESQRKFFFGWLDHRVASQIKGYVKDKP